MEEDPNNNGMIEKVYKIWKLNISLLREQARDAIESKLHLVTINTVTN